MVPMKNLLPSFFLLLTLSASRGADVITLTGMNTYTVRTNEVVEVIAVGNNGTGSLAFTLNGGPMLATKVNSSSTVSLLPMTIAGAGHVIGAFESTYPPNPQNAFVTLRIRTKTEYLASLNPPSPVISSSVVIPEDATGPVSIVMESSTDLVNWVAANPGNYGASTPRRFFRVRAIQN